MIVFRRRPTSPATKRQRKHIAELNLLQPIQSATCEGDTFALAALDFVRMFDQGKATQGMYADCVTLWNDYRKRLAQHE